MQSETAWVQLVDAPLQIESLRARLDHPDAGSQGWFIGVTRRTTADRITETLYYESHVPMAQRELEKLAERAIEKFSLLRLVIVHRLGEVPILEASVIVGCSSAHRVETFAALAWIMDTLKQEVPIWKRELFADGSTEWVHPGTDGQVSAEQVSDRQVSDGQVSDGQASDRQASDRQASDEQAPEVDR